ncbi:29411_t:CDS:2 [Gigaspora margarita]|uniref:29411_t:CDS:1 n=1 Tax=Gigaspora margarita TaxID=4874 RepID=A0ABN7VZZ5_GIGMA|nr:29411_t:CDS:2 [Gigaspora margarita]
MSFEVPEMGAADNMLFKLTEIDTTSNMSFILTEIDTNEMPFELGQLESAESRKWCAQITAQNIIHPTHENIESARERKNRLKREAYARRKSTLTTEQIEQQPRMEQYNSNIVSLHNLGFMNIECEQCSALHWKDEKIARTVKKPIFSTCCAKGKVILQPLAPTLPLLRSLLTDNNTCARDF